MMDFAENSLVAGNVKETAQALEHLAALFGAIDDRQGFFNLRKSIIQSAMAKTNRAFIEEMLEQVERERADDRGNTSRIIIPS